MTAKSTLITGATLVNEGKTFLADLLIKSGRIERIDSAISPKMAQQVIEADGKLLIPGMIDDQVHFREPGLTYKGEIATESKAAIVGGITSYMEMPNVRPATISHDALRDKLRRAAQVSHANYAFYMGTTNENLEAIKSLPPNLACGIKIFMGSSTGNMLVDNPQVLQDFFRHAPVLIATHCEDTPSIQLLEQKYALRYGENIPAHCHAEIRSAEACYKSSSLAVALAKEYKTNLHVLHITTAKELELFSSNSLQHKHITAEACVHHLWFTQEDYSRLNHQIKCNPSIKLASDRNAIRAAVIDGRIDVIATDHAPHTYEEKQKTYATAPAGLPLVQHALPMLFDLVKQGIFTYEQIVQKTSHHVAQRFQIDKRGFLREGYWADVVIVNPNQPQLVETNNLYYKCKWSPLTGHLFSHRIETTFVSGQLAFHQGHVHEPIRGQPLEFTR